ncbi:hypothetical protein DFH09DRAFT_1108773 [Mycena vulgaris]|nr:hypothetical protein DFH09DRAFT_1108773 [Mycena vulgaris]
MAVRYFSGGLNHNGVLHSVLLRGPGARSMRVQAREEGWRKNGEERSTHPRQIPLKLFDNRRKAADLSRHVVEGRALTVPPDGGAVMSCFWSWYMWCCTTAAAHGIRVDTWGCKISDKNKEVLQEEFRAQDSDYLAGMHPHGAGTIALPEPHFFLFFGHILRARERTHARTGIFKPFESTHQVDLELELATTYLTDVTASEIWAWCMDIYDSIYQ